METIYGPVNYAKLSGEIENTHKILHIFCDKNLPFVSNESNTLEIFLTKLFQSSKHIWDMFVEADILDKPTPQDGKQLYLTNIKNYAYENKIGNVYSNLRIHHVDIKWISTHFLGIDFILEQLKSGNIEAKIKASGIESISAYFNTTSLRIQTLLSIISSIKNKKEWTSSFGYEQRVYKILFKLILNIDKCQNDQLKLVLNNLLDQYVLNLEKLAISMLNIKSFNLCVKLVTDLYASIANIINIYIIRRLLDKKYIEKSIIYINTYHAYGLINTLKKYFNFEIEYMSKNPFDNFMSDNSEDIFNLIIKTPNLNEQSVEIENILFE